MKTSTEPRDSGAPPRTTAYHELGHEYLVITDPRIGLIDPGVLERHPPIQHDPEHHELTYLRRTFTQQHSAVANAIAKFGYYPLDVPKHLVEDLKAMPGILSCRAYSRTGEAKPYQYDFFAITRETYDSAVAFLKTPRPMNRDQRLAIQELLEEYQRDPKSLEYEAKEMIEEIEHRDLPATSLRERIATYDLDYNTAERLVQFTRQPSKKQRELVRELVSAGRAHPHFLPGTLHADPRKKTDEDRSLKKANPSDQAYLDRLTEEMSAGTASRIIDAGFTHASSEQRTHLRAFFQEAADAPDMPSSVTNASASIRDIWEITHWEAKAALDTHDNALLAQMREDENRDELETRRQERSEHFYDTRIHPIDVEPYTAPYKHHRRVLPREGVYFGQIVAIVKQGNGIRYAMLHLPGDDQVLELQRSQGRGFYTYLSDLNQQRDRNGTEPTDYLDSEEFQQAFRGKYAAVRLTVQERKASAYINVLPEIFQRPNPSQEYIDALTHLAHASAENTRTTDSLQGTTIQYFLSALEIRPSSSCARLGTPEDIAPGTNAQYLGSHKGHHWVQTTYTNLVSAVDPDDIGVFESGITPGEPVLVGRSGQPLRHIPEIFQSSTTTPTPAPSEEPSPTPLMESPHTSLSPQKRATRTKRSAKPRSR